MALTKISRGLLDTGVSDSSDATAITIDSSENVGIGTASPTDKLTVAGNITVSDGSPEVTFQTGSSHYNWQLAAQESTNSAFEIAVGSADGDASNDSFSALVTVLQSGNVGIGITPESHYADYACIDFGKTGLLQSATSGTNITALLNNAYLDTNVAWKYKETDEACLYQQTGGNHIFFTAASGSADATISWSERMRIASDGVITQSVGPATAGAVGTYALLWRVDATTANSFGDTLAGSNLRAANTYANGSYSNFGYGSSSMSGTWRCMGQTGIYNGSTAYSSTIWMACTVWVRVS